MNNGAIALSCTVGSGGVMKISSGAAYNNFKALNGGKVTGNYDCYGIEFSSGAIADINIFNTSAGNTKAVVSNLYYARNRGTVFTLTVSASQTKGTYKLASNASGFNESITVQNIYGDKLGTLSLGQAVNIGSSSYKLDLDSDNVLSVSVGAAAMANAKSDINGNGKDSVLMSFQGAAYYTVDIDGAGTGGVATLLASSDANWTVRAIGDFSGDGKDDIIAYNASASLVAM